MPITTALIGTVLDFYFVLSLCLPIDYLRLSPE
jgi:hypothetical protein